MPLLVWIASHRSVLVGLEELENPLGLFPLGFLLLDPDQAKLGVRSALIVGHHSEDAGTGVSLLSASRAASCPAAFFEPPLPPPSRSPLTLAAQAECRTCGGPSAV